MYNDTTFDLSMGDEASLIVSPIRHRMVPCDSLFGNQNNRDSHLDLTLEDQTFDYRNDTSQGCTLLMGKQFLDVDALFLSEEKKFCSDFDTSSNKPKVIRHIDFNVSQYYCDDVTTLEESSEKVSDQVSPKIRKRDAKAQKKSLTI